ncbi:hypothetical protein GH5_05421 [Leishmania sp. Ghana 2012 LV757]|uniref:hypothetical protein n=1 Tax=Leishmania sp. Ghana 2012 LV757 TaxID=2803181 RepID=UPI001B6EF9D4|nr:hypothetical protein GH5_05421 [Leishmania sp. Ghana 2012 LV757]
MPPSRVLTERKPPFRFRFSTKRCGGGGASADSLEWSCGVAVGFGGLARRRTCFQRRPVHLDLQSRQPRVRACADGVQARRRPLPLPEKGVSPA